MSDERLRGLGERREGGFPLSEVARNSHWKNERSCYYLFMHKGSQTKSEILRVALGEASRFGLEGLSIGGLAKDVGMSKSGLFAHFGSKLELQRSVLDHARNLFAQYVVVPSVQMPRGVARVRALFENWLTWTDVAKIPGGCVFASTAAEFDDRPGPVRDVVAKYVGEWRQIMARAVEIAIEEGHFRPDVEPGQFAFEMHAIMLGYQMDARLFRRKNSRDRAVRAFEQLLTTSR